MLTGQQRLLGCDATLVGLAEQSADHGDDGRAS